MSEVSKLQGVIQNYAWGGNEFIPKLLGAKSTEKKCAEYWLGAHNNAPSEIIDSSGNQKLNEFISNDLIGRLGSRISGAFGRLPFLFKVLDVHDMLSIQVHPTKIEAEKGFKRENELGISVTAPNRNYKDDNHKPEIMVALSEFWLLHGFLTKEKLLAQLKETKELNHLIPVFENRGFKGLYKKVMEESQEETNAILKPLIERLLPQFKEGKLEKSSAAFWAAKAYETFCEGDTIDKGIYSIYFFNIVKANKGEAVFQDAGIPHAYLEGQNMELMANSDNVLRGGLTPKHVDVPELLKHVVFEETVPNIMNGELQLNGVERIYKSPAPDFELSQLKFTDINNVYESVSDTVEIFMVINGKVEIKSNGEKLKFDRGEAAVIFAGTNYSVKGTNESVIYKATAP